MDERQAALEILGSAIDELMPDFRASGSASEHAEKVAAELRSRFVTRPNHPGYGTHCDLCGGPMTQEDGGFDRWNGDKRVETLHSRCSVLDSETRAVIRWVAEQTKAMIESGNPIRSGVIMFIDVSGDASYASRLQGRFRLITVGALAELQHSIIARESVIVEREDDNGHSSNRP